MTYSAERIEEDCYKLGKDYFGPFLYGFVKWLHREIVERSIDKAFFSFKRWLYDDKGV